MADFLPATLGTMVSYFSSEVTRGLWKPVSMNGTDWPSPAANLASVEQQIEKILAATGVDVPRLPAGNAFLLSVKWIFSDSRGFVMKGYNLRCSHGSLGQHVPGGSCLDL